jgi:hypothetical protein
MSVERTADLRISDVPTAFVRICFGPTLFRGSWVTAYEVPPNATKTAMVAITLAYDRCERRRLIEARIRLR